MKHEVNLDDEVIFQRVREELNKFARISTWGEQSGTVMGVVNEQVKELVRKQVYAIDLSGLIQREIDTHLMPTLLEIVRKQIETEAKKQVKLAMAKRGEA